MRAGFAESLAEALNASDSEASSNEGIEVDPAGDDVASCGGICDSVAVGERETVENFCLDQGEVVAAGVSLAGVKVPAFAA